MRFSLRQLLVGMAMFAVTFSVIWWLAQPHWGRIYNNVNLVAFSPDGKQLAISHYSARDANVPLKGYVANESITVALIDTATLANAATVKHEFRKGNQGPGLHHWRYTSLAFDPAYNFLYFTDWQTGQLQAWDVANKCLVIGGRFGAGQIDFKISPDGKWVGTTGLRGVMIRNSDTSQPDFTKSEWTCVRTFSPDSKLVAIDTRNGIQVWDLGSQKLIRTFHPNHDVLDAVTCAAISPDADTIAFRCQEGLRLYSLRTGEEHELLPEFFEITRTGGGWGIKTRGGQATYGVAFSPDGKLFSAWGAYGTKFFNMSTGYKLQRESSETSTIWLAFAPDGKTYATGHNTGKVAISDTATGKELRSKVIPP
jgi:WD40 repeat protein